MAVLKVGMDIIASFRLHAKISQILVWDVLSPPIHWLSCSRFIFASLSVEFWRDLWTTRNLISIKTKSHDRFCDDWIRHLNHLRPLIVDNLPFWKLEFSQERRCHGSVKMIVSELWVWFRLEQGVIVCLLLLFVRINVFRAKIDVKDNKQLFRF
jgi:hypothetical protein